MGRLSRTLIACLAMTQLAACAAPAAFESQLKQRDARSARFYFLREKGLLGAMGGTAAAVEVKVDGKVVGSLNNGFYFFVDRPPGTHKLSVDGKVSMAMAFETDVDVEAGQSYYFNIGPAGSSPGQTLVNQAVMGGKGEQMRGASPFSGALSAWVFYRLDPAIGAAEVAQLKTP
jgi:hypothetical protein